MSDFENEPLAPDLAALFEREKHAYGEDPAMKARVLSHVEWAVTLGGPPDGSGGHGGGTGDGGAGHGGHDAGDAGHGDIGHGGDVGHGLAGHAAAAGASTAAGFGLKTIVAATVSAFVAGGAVGGTVVTQTQPAPVTSPSPRSSTPASVAKPPATVEAPSLAPLSEPPDLEPLTKPPPASPRAEPPPADTRGDITRERELLDAARAALARGRPDDAIATAERHAQKWPRGYLVEEREAVLIQALALAGRRDEAARRGNAFRKAYPQSILLPTIDAVLSSPSSTP